MTVDVSQLIQYAEAQLGKPYIFGTAGPNTFDCSGLVTYVMGHFGVQLPHHSEDQATYGVQVPKTSIRPGDLVFSDWGDGANSHVGIAVTPTKIIDAPHTGAVVRYDDLSPGYLAHVTAVRRINGVAGTAPTSVPGGGGGTGGGTGGLLSRFEGALVQAEQIFTGPYQELAKPLQDIGSAAGEVAGLGDKLLHLFYPSNFLRIMSGGVGLILILMGLWLLSVEARS